MSALLREILNQGPNYVVPRMETRNPLVLLLDCSASMGMGSGDGQTNAGARLNEFFGEIILALKDGPAGGEGGSRQSELADWAKHYDVAVVMYDASPTLILPFTPVSDLPFRCLRLARSTGPA